MSNQFFDFDLAFKKILFVIETLKKEGVEIFPALRINDYYKPGYHGREQRAYSEHFFCLALLRENDAVICYLESANFGPKSDLLFMKIQTEKVSLKHILRLTTNEFKNKLGSHLFLPSDPTIII